MNAGPELDTLIAERVMGWHLTDQDSMIQCDVNGDPVEGGPTWRDENGKHTGWYAWNWTPSRSIGSAWHVVERITRIPQSIAEAEQMANTRFGYWWDQAHLWAYSSKEAAEAICQMALVCVEAHDPRGGQGE